MLRSRVAEVLPAHEQRDDRLDDRLAHDPLRAGADVAQADRVARLQVTLRAAEADGGHLPADAVGLQDESDAFGEREVQGGHPIPPAIHQITDVTAAVATMTATARPAKGHMGVFSGFSCWRRCSISRPPS